MSSTLLRRPRVVITRSEYFVTQVLITINPGDITTYHVDADSESVCTVVVGFISVNITAVDEFRLGGGDAFTIYGGRNCDMRNVSDTEAKIHIMTITS